MPILRQENDAPVSLTSHRWGWVNPPPGMDQLGQVGPYAGIKVQVSSPLPCLTCTQQKMLVLTCLYPRTSSRLLSILTMSPDTHTLQRQRANVHSLPYEMDGATLLLKVPPGKALSPSPSAMSAAPLQTRLLSGKSGFCNHTATNRDPIGAVLFAEAIYRKPETSSMRQTWTGSRAPNICVTTSTRKPLF